MMLCLKEPRSDKYWEDLDLLLLPVISLRNKCPGPISPGFWCSPLALQ